MTTTAILVGIVTRNRAGFHDSQPGAHKADVSALASMELVNRHYVMTQVLGRRGWLDYFRLFVWEAFHLAVGAIRAESRRSLPARCRGKWQAVQTICHSLRLR